MSSAGSIAVDLTLNQRAFNKQVQNSVNSTKKAFEGAGKSAKSAFDSAGKSAQNAAKQAENSFTSSFKKIGLVIASAFAVQKIVQFGKTCVQAASDAQAAWTGLNSIVQGTGNDFATAQNFLTKYTQDGLVAVEDAATAYKNLLARGYDTTQIEGVMTALKDSAAFGRQSSYTLSQAVVSATEGLKNENSILVDNAGVTKNVAKMWEDYAHSIGKTTTSLTQQEKIQAEVNGILTETKFQAGDAATYTSTFAGRVQQLHGAFISMKTAIGKVIAPIANLFIPAITAAVNAITTLFTKLAGLLKVFGLEFPDVVAKTSSSVGTAARGIGDIGTNADNASASLARTGSAAAKAAKKMNKAFSSVDEINVMKFNNTDTSSGSSGGSGGGSSGGGGASTSISGGGAVDTGSSAISSAIEKTSQDIQNAVKPLSSINFDNLINAFKNLWDAVKPLGKTIWEGLKWAYDEILKPLAKWTIEDLLPAFINLLAGALRVANPLIKAFGNVFQPVWDNLLKPLLSWTGGVIVDVINGVADALGKLGDWMSEHQTVVDNMVRAFVIFFGLWEVTKLAAAIQIMGGLGAAIGVVTGALWSNIAAKLVDKAETVALTVLYAKDFVVSIMASVKALALQAAAFIAANAPIILMVAAITAVIAVVVLLIKHWDDVKEAALKCWEKIKEVWQKVKDWFVEKVIEPIKKFFSELWDKIKSLASDAWNGVKAVWQAVKDWFNDTIIQPVKTFFTNMWDSIKNAASNAWNGIKAIWQIVKDWFNNTIIQPVKNVFTGLWDGLKNGAGKAWEGIKSVFSSVADFFKNTFTKAWTAVKNVFSTGGKIFDGIKDGIVDAFKAIVNGIITGINKVVAVPFNAINKILNKLKGISIAGIHPFKWVKTFNVPQIPKLAQGAYFEANNPQLAIIGDNKTQGEIVAPEDKIRENVKQAIQEMGGMFGSENLKFDFNIKLIGEDGRTIIKKINDVTIQDGKVTLLI